jgi:hypothetical protein
MSGERRVLRLGEYMVRHACQRLPQEIREEHYREWAAELPAILHDPQVRPAPWRAVRMLVYAADTLRGTALTPGWTRGRRPRLSAAGDLLFLVAALVLAALNTWSIVQTPGDWQKYVLPAWSVLFVAYLTRKRVHPAGRMTALLYTSSTLTLVAWNAAQGNWLNYIFAALVFIPLPILLLAWWLRVAMPARGRHAPRESN